MDKINQYIKEKNKRDIKKILKFCFFNIFLIFLILFEPFFERHINFLYNPNLNTNLHGSDFVVTYLDVGQADCTFIEFPNKKCMMIDCGIDYNNSENSKIAVENFLNNYFKSKEKYIDYFIITHPDYDHIGNGLYIFDNYKIGTFFRPNIFSIDEIELYNLSESVVNYCDKDFYNILINKVNDSHCEDVMIDCFNKNDYSLEINGAKFKFLAPTKYKLEDFNDLSLVIEIVYNGKSFVFTGDISADVESDIINIYGSDLKIDVLKISHHGSNNASSEDFLTLSKPKYAIISVGKDNGYYHPSELTLQRLKNVIDINAIIKTSSYGNISVGVDSDGIIKIFAQHAKFFETYYIKIFDIVCILEITVLLKILIDKFLYDKINKIYHN